MQDAELALSAIIQAMKHTECLAIVRKVYSKDRGLSLGVLYPFIEEFETDDPDEISSKEVANEKVPSSSLATCRRVSHGLFSVIFSAFCT